MSFLSLKRILTLGLALVVLGLPLMAGWFANAKGTVGSWFNSPKSEIKAESREEKKVFTHLKHTEEGASCADCHKADKAGKMQKPGLEQCKECHDGSDILTADQLAGKFAWSSESHLSKEVIFSHDTHVSADVKCLSCHKGIDQNKNVADHSWLKMKDCTTCQEQEVSKESATDCTVCHTKINKDSKPDFHGAAFKRGHGMMARMGAGETRADCTLCHKENQCTACHATEMPKSHNSHFTHRGHGIAASIDRESCATCHRTDTCESCHATTAPTNHTSAFGGTKSRHCGTCHFPQAQTECYTCHKSAPSHLNATALPTNTAHVKATANDCRNCHVAGKLKHMDNGQSCKECHR